MNQIPGPATRLLFVVLLGAVALTTSACANRYKITLTNGHVITTHGRPKYDKAADVFRCKDVEDRPRTIPSITVKEIEPL